MFTADGWPEAPSEDLAELRGRVETVIGLLEANPRLAKTASTLLAKSDKESINPLTVGIRPAKGSSGDLPVAVKRAIQEAGGLVLDRQVLAVLMRAPS